MKSLLLISTLSFLVLNGCASSATVEGMRAYPELSGTRHNKHFKDSIRVETVTGGSATNPLWVSKISSEDFKQALAQSLKSAGYQAQDSQSAKYALVVTLMAVEQPLFGLDMTVTTRVNYMLKDKQTYKVLYHDNIHATHTTGFGEALSGITRLRLANEGSAKKNIIQLLTLLQDFTPNKVAIRLE